MVLVVLGCTTTSSNPAAPTTTASYELNELPIKVTSAADGRIRVDLPRCSTLSPASVVVFDKPSTPITDAAQLTSASTPYWRIERDAGVSDQAPSELVIGETPAGFHETTQLTGLPLDQPLLVWISWSGSAGFGVAATFSGQEFVVSANTPTTAATIVPDQVDC
jgi:hypothetical protein